MGYLVELFGRYFLTRELVTAAFVAAQVNVAMVEPDLPDPHYRGVASRFGDLDDKWVGGNLKCDPTRRVQPEDHICAHRVLSARRSCGTVLILENPRTKKRSWCMVMDSGPFGAKVYEKGASGKYTKPVYVDGRHAWYVKIRRGDKPPPNKCPSGDCIGKWRGYLDISPAAAEELGHNGMERIHAWRADRLNKQLDSRRKKSEKLWAFLYEGFFPRDRVAALWGP
jgi:hypothetical protein